MANPNPELDEKYQLVKADIVQGMKVSQALAKHNLDHGAYYGRREADPDPIKKLVGDWSRTKKKVEKTPAVLTVPLKSKSSKLEEKIVAIVCQPSQLKTILEGLNDE